MILMGVTENSLEQLVDRKSTIVFLLYDVVSVGLVRITRRYV